MGIVRVCINLNDLTCAKAFDLWVKRYHEGEIIISMSRNVQTRYHIISQPIHKKRLSNNCHEIVDD